MYRDVISAICSVCSEQIGNYCIIDKKYIIRRYSSKIWPFVSKLAQTVPGVECRRNYVLIPLSELYFLCRSSRDFVTALARVLAYAHDRVRAALAEILQNVVHPLTALNGLCARDPVAPYVLYCNQRAVQSLAESCHALNCARSDNTLIIAALQQFGVVIESR